MINRAIITGRLTRDPDLRYSPQGNAVCNFTLAVQRPFKNANGENEADFINVVVFREQAENAANYLKKGNMAGVDGRIQTRSYENKQGQRVFVTEVVADRVQFLELKNKDKSAQNVTKQLYGDPFAGDGKTIDVPDDSLPF